MKKALLSALPSVEPLEARIAPATLTFVDIDGDQVTITTSKGTDADLAAAVNPFLVDSGAGKLLQKIDLSANPVFKGTNISITAEVGGSGDGVVNIGYLDARAIDLGRVTVDGDLGRIAAGDSKLSTPALKSLTIGSLGALGTVTQNSSDASLYSHIHGALPTLSIAKDVGGTLDVSGGAKLSAGRIGTIEIGGSLIGGDEEGSGQISATGAIGFISVSGVQGGTGAHSGFISAASIKSLTVLGSITGGSGEHSGAIVAGPLMGSEQQPDGSISKVGAIGSISISSLQGGTGANSGFIGAASIKSLTVAESIMGGDGEYSGAIRVRGEIQSVDIGENIVGGLSQSAHHSGEIRANGTIANAHVGGKVQGGGGTNSGAITSGQGLGKIEIDGGLIGGGGLESGTVGTRGTIQSVTIGTELTGGAGERSGAVLATAKISDVTINGDITGGGGESSGVVATDGGLGKVTVNGDVKGGIGRESGAIGSTKTLSSVYISGNLEGGSGVRSGVVVSSTSIDKVIIDGSVIGGTNDESGAVGSSGPVKFVRIGGDLQGGGDFHAGAILSGHSLGKIEIGGSLRGGTSSESGIIFTRGVIGSVTIGENLEGGDSFKSGLIEGTRVENVRIGGDVFGGGGTLSGSINARNFNPVVDVDLVSGHVSVTPEPLLGTISVRGNVYGSDGSLSGAFISEGRINSVTIGIPGIIIEREISEGQIALIEGEGPFPPIFGGGSLHGGSGYGSGSIVAEGNIGSVTIFGNLNGGYQSGEASPYNSGRIGSGGDIQKVFIGRDLRGGDASYHDLSEGGSETEGPGQIYARGRIGDVEIRGSVIGSYGENSATIRSGAIGSIKVGESVSAGRGSYSASFIAEEQDIKSIKIGGELTTYTNAYESAGYHAGSIAAARNLGKLEIGTIVGSPDAHVTITAGGQIGARTDAQALAIGSLTIRNSTSYADILAGYDIYGNAVNPDAQIGTVTVGVANRGGEPSFAWAFTNVVAGSLTGFDGVFGTDDDLLIPESSESSRVISKIARVVINGYIVNGGEGESVQQGIVAAQVGSVTLMGDKAPLKAGPRNDVSVTFPFDPILGINEPKNAFLPV